MRQSRIPYYALFTLSGFSGLIYESIWTHYLKLFLGHAAYAQTLVLAIFMGGMAVGAWLCSRYSVRWKNLLLAYALAEALIGIAALGFHSVFDGFLQLSYSTLIPGLGSPGAVQAFKWTSAALLILPQSILLGMTFPLMSGGVLRRFADRPGGTVAMLYFTNSIGAVFGVLTSGFLLIGSIGLPGTIRLAGAINLLLALAVFWLARGNEPAFSTPARDSNQASPALLRLFLAIALLTGAASFIYEITWIRMLSMVLGSSSHAFELMLSAFILGLALGGLFIKRRIDRVANPVRTLAVIQVAMGLLALATLPLYNQSFDAMVWVLSHVARDETGYLYFNLASHAIAATIMLPATFCAGMTLPLLTLILINHGHGEKSIGAVYGANTVGAIAGVFFATHLGLPLLGLKHLLTFGAGLDIILGLALLWRYAPAVRSYLPAGATAAGVAAIAATLLFVHFSPHKLASGVYRHGRIPAADSIVQLFHEDGKTASIGVVADREQRLFTISTNGKPDASINVTREGKASPDEITMVLAGALPVAMRPRASTAAVIGFGSGLTTHTLASIPAINSIDTVEIESAMVDGARLFEPHNQLAYRNPNSHIHIDDAKTFFSTHNKKYDIIVSEPSNPWVSGVSGLFSGEFYGLIKNHLNDDGVLVQWIQVYEIDLELIASVVKALSGHFRDYVIYVANDDDMLLVGTNGTSPLVPTARIFTVPGVTDELGRLGISGSTDLQLHKIGDRAVLQPLFESIPIPPNSDYYPVLDARAAQSRFMQRGGADLVRLQRIGGIPISRFLGAPETEEFESRFQPNPYLTISDDAFAATLLRDFVLTGQYDPQWGRLSNDARFYAENIRAGLLLCDADIDAASWTISVVGFAQMTVPFLSAAELQRIWGAARESKCFTTSGSTKQGWIEVQLALARRDGAAMAMHARTLLDDPERESAPVSRFLLHALVIGELLQQHREQARDAWTRYASLAYPEGANDLLSRVYRAYLGLTPENNR